MKNLSPLLSHSNRLERSNSQLGYSTTKEQKLFTSQRTFLAFSSSNIPTMMRASLFCSREKVIFDSFMITNASNIEIIMTQDSLISLHVSESKTVLGSGFLTSGTWIPIASGILVSLS